MAFNGVRMLDVTGLRKTYIFASAWPRSRRSFWGNSHRLVRMLALCWVRNQPTALFHRLGWRWAFLLQIPLFALAYVLTDYNLCYVTEVIIHPTSLLDCGAHISLQGKGKSTKEVLKRIDYGGSVALMSFVRSKSQIVISLSSSTHLYLASRSDQFFFSLVNVSTRICP